MKKPVTILMVSIPGLLLFGCAGGGIKQPWCTIAGTVIGTGVGIGANEAISDDEDDTRPGAAVAGAVAGTALGVWLCPEEAKPEPVAQAPEPAPEPEPDPCAPDDDGDGVNNCDDKCSDTLAGAKVDDAGCPIRIELRGGNFDYDSAELTAEAQGVLDGVADALISSGETKDIEVQGHTSSEGSTQYNQGLSERRAQSVVDYLKDKGVTNSLYPKGYGEDYPIADNETEEGRAKNRRVELVFMGE